MSKIDPTFLSTATQQQCIVCLEHKETALRRVAGYVHHVCADCENDRIPDLSDLRNVSAAHRSGDLVREANIMEAAQVRYGEWKRRKADARWKELASR